MKGDATVIEHLNKVLKNELTAINQYFLHSRMLNDWGLTKLGDYEYHESVDEMKHADALIERILFLEGEPDFSNQDQVNVGKDVPEMLSNDLEVEYSVVKALKKAIRVCEEEQDYDSRAILVKLLDDTEMDHAWWLEKQLGLIEKIPYLRDLGVTAVQLLPIQEYDAGQVRAALGRRVRDADLQGFFDRDLVRKVCPGAS